MVPGETGRMEPGGSGRNRKDGARRNREDGARRNREDGVRRSREEQGGWCQEEKEQGGGRCWEEDGSRRRVRGVYFLFIPTCPDPEVHVLGEWTVLIRNQRCKIPYYNQAWGSS